MIRLRALLILVAIPLFQASSNPSPSEAVWTAKWIAAPSGANWLPRFRREVTLSKHLKQATLLISGLGQYEVHINGQNITNAVLTPGWTDYRKRVFYDSYDVTTLLHAGRNEIGVLLGNGIYNVEETQGRYSKFTGSFGKPKLIFQMRLRYDDGIESAIISDKTWSVGPSPIVYSSVYGGEDYDARLEDLNAAQWVNAEEVNGPGGKLVQEAIAPVTVAQTFQAVKVTKVDSQTTVYDLGQNFSGWPEISFQGARGGSVKLIAGELLDANGRVSQHSANASPKSENSFTYTLKGGEVEHWHPRFSYWGFRYVQAETKEAEIESLQGDFLHDDVAVTGTFTSSDPLMVGIHKLIDSAILSNLFSVLTDCPHREKLGWLEESHLAATSIMYNYDVARLYGKISDDMMDDQRPSGMVPSIAPEYVAFVDGKGRDTSFRDSPEWGSAVILSPWAAYQFYGDKQTLRAHYTSMKRYAEYLGTRAQDHMIAYGLGDWYDIGPKAPGESQLTGKGLTATAIYYQDLRAMESIASVLNETADASAFGKEAAAVKEAFNAHLFHADTNEYDQGSQTANAMPLALGLVPEGHEQAVLENLISDIHKHNNHVTAGDVGFHYVVRALTDTGSSEVLYQMLQRTDSPSYGYQLSRGATTLTEAWDTNPNSSQNHFMLGHAEEWFYRGLAGIRIDMSKPAERRIVIAPQPVGEMESASASFVSVLGTVRSSWVRKGKTLTLDISVPPGAVATVNFPARYKTEQRRVVGSGEHRFVGHR